MSRLLATYDDYITFEFGNQILQENPIFHDGIDIVGDTHQEWRALDEIKAHTAGVVIEAEYDDGRGNHILIQTDPDTVMTYNHLESMYVGVGETVEQGQTIGYMGATGGCTGAHLHFGIFHNGEWIDPYPYLNADFGKVAPVQPSEYDCDVTRVLYVDVLGRMPDESGFANYTNYLVKGGTPEGMRECLKASEEYANKPMVNPNLFYFTAKCYSIILGRMAESVEVLEQWAAGEDSLENKIAIFNAIWLSEEAEARRNQ